LRKALGMLVVLLLFCMSFLSTGCQKSESSDMEIEQTSPIAMDLDKLLKYKDSYIGDNSAVGGILFELPGNIYVNNYYLETGVLPFAVEVDYGIKNNSGLEEVDLDKYWTDENTKKIFLNNAAAFFILVQNADEVRFNLFTSEKRAFLISRDEMEDFLGKDLRKYAENKDLWSTEVIENSVNNKERLQLFYSKYKIN